MPDQRNFSTLFIIIILMVLIVAAALFYAYRTTKYNQKYPQNPALGKMVNKSTSNSALLSKDAASKRAQAELQIYPKLAQLPSERSAVKQDLNSNNYLAQYQNITFHVTWADFKKIASLTKNSSRLDFSADKSITISLIPPDLLLKKEDLNLDEKDLLNRYRLASNIDINLQQEIMGTTPDLVSSSKTSTEANQKLKMLLLKTLIQNATKGSMVIVHRNDGLTVIVSQTPKYSRLDLQDYQNNYYTILLYSQSVSAQDIDGVISTIEIK